MSIRWGRSRTIGTPGTSLTAWCWGSDDYGQLGDGTTGDSLTHQRRTAVKVRRPTSSFTGVRKLGGGVGHMCALRIDAYVWCWGYNANGQLGRGSSDEDPHPFPLRVTVP